MTEVSEQRHAVLIKHRAEQSKNLYLFYLIHLITLFSDIFAHKMIKENPYSGKGNPRL